MAKILDRDSSHKLERGTAPPTPSLISVEKLISIYTAMLRCRMFQQRAAALFQQGKLDRDLPASSGREACAAAVVVDLEAEDAVSIDSVDWLPGFAKGLPAETLFRGLAPRANDHSLSVANEAQKQNIFLGESNGDRPAEVRARAEALHAARSPAIVAAFLQPGADTSISWQTVVSAAAKKNLPIVFVQHVVDGRRLPAASPGSRSKLPPALFRGVPSIAVDAADPVALYRVAHEAISRARQGRGATLLECAAIAPLGSPDPNHPAQPPDPIAVMESYLKRKGVEPERCHRQAAAEFTRDLDLATRFLVS